MAVTNGSPGCSYLFGSQSAGSQPVFQHAVRAGFITRVSVRSAQNREIDVDEKLIEQIEKDLSERVKPGDRITLVAGDGGHLTPDDAHRHVLSVFRGRAIRSSKTVAYTLFDYLHDFRIWANYLEIEHLLNLRGAGYKAFMDQALAFILFFVGGITELVLIASSSPTRFLNHSQRFFSLLAASSTEVEMAYPELPLAQRLDLFSQLGLLRRGLIYPTRIDPNQVRARFDD